MTDIALTGAGKTSHGAAGAPVAEFSATPTSGGAPLTVSFTDLSTNTPTSWSWERNDGGGWTVFSTAQHPANIEFASGLWDIRLTATNGQGSDTETKLDYINSNAA